MTYLYFEICSFKEMQKKKISKKLNSIKLFCKIFKSGVYPVVTELCKTYH